MSPRGLPGLLLAPWWARLQHYAWLTALPLLSSLLSCCQIHTLSCGCKLAEADGSDAKKNAAAFIVSVHEGARNEAVKEARERAGRRRRRGGDGHMRRWEESEAR